MKNNQHRAKLAVPSREYESKRENRVWDLSTSKKFGVALWVGNIASLEPCIQKLGNKIPVDEQALLP